jgi:hypothetical protein
LPNRATKNDNDENLMKSLVIQTPVVPHHGRVLAGRTGIALLGVNEVVEFSGILDEEDRGVVSQQVPVSFFGVERGGKAPRITFGVGGPLLAPAVLNRSNTVVCLPIS